MLAAALLLQSHLGAGDRPSEPAGRLSPADAVTDSLQGGESHLFEIAAPLDRIWRITAEQLGVDVQLEVTDADGGVLLAVDSPLHRQGRVSLLFEPSASPGPAARPGPRYRVAVHSTEPGAPSGSYTLALEALTRAGLEERGLRVAETEHTAAGRLYAVGTGEALRQAAAHYLREAEEWRRLERPAEERLALFSRAVVLGNVGETAEALELHRRLLEKWRETGDTALEAASLAEAGLLVLDRGDTGHATAMFERGVELCRNAGDHYGMLTAMSNRCLVKFHLGELQQGLECYQPVFALLAGDREPELEAVAHINVGKAYDVLGKPDRALEHYQHAVELQRRIGDQRGEAGTLNNLATLNRALGDTQRALDLYQLALARFREAGDRTWEARILNNIGYAYLVLGEPQRALSFFRQALPLRRQTPNRWGEVATLKNLGLAYRDLGDDARALEQFGQARRLARELDDPRQEATALRLAGWTKLSLGDAAAAIDHCRQALELLGRVGDRPQEADALHLCGRGRFAAGDVEAAVENLARSVALSREIRHPEAEADALVSLARAERRRGHRQAARDAVAAARALIESQRARVRSPDLRASFLGSRHAAYELEVELLMDLHAGDPAAGHERRALEVNELSRARTLIELLDEAGAGPGDEVEPELLQRRAALLGSLNAKAARRLESLVGPSRGADDRTTESELDAEIEDLLHELDRVEAEIRASSRRYAILTDPEGLPASEIQALLEPGTLLLEYALGDQRSFLWAVGNDTIEAFELPGRAELEPTARRLHEQLGALEPTAPGEPPEAAALAAWLLGPVAGKLSGQRLVVVADGALHYVPFGVLPRPGPAGAGEPLLARHEVVHLPSASALAALRRDVEERPAAEKWAVVVADPVFDSWDPRLPETVRAPAAGPEAAAESPGRLPATRREAETIASLAPPGEVVQILDFAANRDELLAGTLGCCRIVHFATHGVIDARNPRLSGLLLSRVDPEGRSRPGFLGLSDLFGLRLRADLAVLSGCRTALGREIHGEGLVGLTRGLMYAGAPRVVASLWSVPDRATGELMSRFYRLMAEDGLRPAAALRAAQLAIRGERRWRDAHYWGAFVLQGEWRGADASEVKSPAG